MKLFLNTTQHTKLKSLGSISLVTLLLTTSLGIAWV